jgi:hypothetical protein
MLIIWILAAANPSSLGHHLSVAMVDSRRLLVRQGPSPEATDGVIATVACVSTSFWRPLFLVVTFSHSFSHSIYLSSASVSLSVSLHASLSHSFSLSLSRPLTCLQDPASVSIEPLLHTSIALHTAASLSALMETLLAEVELHSIPVVNPLNASSAAAASATLRLQRHEMYLQQAPTSLERSTHYLCIHLGFGVFLRLGLNRKNGKPVLQLSASMWLRRPLANLEEALGQQQTAASTLSLIA